MKSSKLKKSASGGASRKAKARVTRPPGYYVAAAKVRRAMRAAISAEETVNDVPDDIDRDVVEEQDGHVSDQS